MDGLPAGLAMAGWVLSEGRIRRLAGGVEDSTLESGASAVHL